MSNSTARAAGGPTDATESLDQLFVAWLRGALVIPELEGLRRDLLGMDQEAAA